MQQLHQVRPASWKWPTRWARDHIATGHYARIRFDRSRRALPAAARAWIDAKDQTYFLFGLTQEQLARTLFPLGEMNKTEVRELARELGLPVAAKGDSQEICFVPNGDYAAFLDAYLREQGVARGAYARRDRRHRTAARWASTRACTISPSASGAGLRHRDRRAAVRDRDRPGHRSA